MKRYITALLLFGLNGIVASFIELGSYEIVMLRTLLGSAVLLVIFLAGKNGLTALRHGRELLSLCVSGAAMGASWIFLYEAYREIGVSLASLAYYCGPVLVMALSPLLFRERLGLGKIAGFAVVLAGILLVNGQAAGRDKSGWGLFCGMASAVMYAVMVIFNKRAASIKGLENATIQLLASFVAVACFVGIRRGWRIEIPASSILPLCVLGVLNTGIGCYLYFSSIGALPVQTVAVLGYLEPLSALVFSALLLGETLLPLQLAGAALIIGGAALSLHRPAAKA